MQGLDFSDDDHTKAPQKAAAAKPPSGLKSSLKSNQSSAASTTSANGRTEKKIQFSDDAKGKEGPGIPGIDVGYGSGKLVFLLLLLSLSLFFSKRQQHARSIDN